VFPPQPEALPEAPSPGLGKEDWYDMAEQTFSARETRVKGDFAKGDQERVEVKPASGGPLRAPIAKQAKGHEPSSAH